MFPPRVVPPWLLPGELPCVEVPEPLLGWAVPLPALPPVPPPVRRHLRWCRRPLAAPRRAQAPRASRSPRPRPGPGAARSASPRPRRRARRHRPCRHRAGAELSEAERAVTLGLHVWQLRARRGCEGKRGQGRAHCSEPPPASYPRRIAVLHHFRYRQPAVDLQSAAPVWTPVSTAKARRLRPVAGDFKPARVAIVVHPTRRVDGALETLRRWTEEHGLEMVQLQVAGGPDARARSSWPSSSPATWWSRSAATARCSRRCAHRRPRTRPCWAWRAGASARSRPSRPTSSARRSTACAPVTGRRAGSRRSRSTPRTRRTTGP